MERAVENVQNKVKEKEMVVKGTKLNLMVLGLMLPLGLLSIGPFILISGFRYYIHHINSFLNLNLFVLLFLGILVHEALHGLTWMLLLKKGFKHIKFGFNTHSFSPYTHCNLPMQVWQYRLGGLMPGLLMGIIPIIVSYFLNSIWLNFVGFLFLWAAGGDIISLIMLRKLPKNTKVIDHPEEMGYIVLGE